MSIELMIRAHSAEDLREQLTKLVGSLALTVTIGAGGSGGAEAPKVDKPKADPKPKVDEKPADDPKPPVDEAPKDEPKPEPEGAADEAEITYEGHVKPAVLRVSAKHGRPGVEKLLADFGVDHASKVEEAKWPEFLAAIDKLLEG